MSLPRYESYRESGVEWLGEVPSHWEIRPLKALFGIVGGSTPKSDNEEFWDGGLVWITPGDLSGLAGFEISTSQRTISKAGLASCSSSLVPAGSVILSTRAPIGTIGIVQVEACTNQGCKALVPNGAYNVRLLAYVLQSAVNELNIRGRGTTFLELSSDELGAFRIPVPSQTEQAAIAAFLDRETAKIDALVEAQRRLIELLKEKRQAVISHAVTKGLDPTAPMKDSGVEWLGEVPAHWEVVRFSRRVSIAEGQVDPREEPYASMPLIAPNHIEGGTGRLISIETAAEQGADSGKYKVLSGDIVYSKIRPNLAKAVLAPQDGLCSADMYPLRGDDRLGQLYLLLLILCPGFTAWATLESDRVAMPKINRESLQQLMLPVPPLAEQAAIVKRIKAEVSAIDPLLQQAETAITLLQERRCALISAAVTGKIDVRGLVAADISEAA